MTALPMTAGLHWPGRAPARAPSPTIVLAHQPDFSLGTLMVRPSTLEVTRAGWTESLEPRVMQVLVALQQARGAVLSRDDLLARCWDGRVVGEDALNRAIGRLRKLAKADQGASFGIETIPRVGYRLRHDRAPHTGGWRKSAIAFICKLLEG